MTSYWIGVASRDHVRSAVAGEFCQLCHGKASHRFGASAPETESSTTLRGNACGTASPCKHSQRLVRSLKVNLNHSVWAGALCLSVGR
jgi:hypothetical protein